MGVSSFYWTTMYNVLRPIN